MESLDSFRTKKSIIIDNKEYKYFSLKTFFNKINIKHEVVPYSLKVLIENFLRNEENKNVNLEKFKNFKTIYKNKNLEFSFYPTRVLMQDFTGVPAVVDLAAMREALKKRSIKPDLINPKIPVDLVIDHSVSVDYSGDKHSFSKNVELEFDRNRERYEFLKWGQNSFKNFNVVPPGTGICHQVNLEYLTKTIWVKNINGSKFIFPDSLVGTDSHTTMINALSVLGWGVGGIEAEATILGEPISINLPEVIAVNFSGKLSEGVTATDLVLTVTEHLRKKGVVGKFVEFIGTGVSNITLADRATIANMSPEYGATCGFFPTDQETINYLALTGKTKHELNLVRQYSEIQGLWLDNSYTSQYNDIVNINLSEVSSSLAGPKRPQDRVQLYQVPKSFQDFTKNKKMIDKLQNSELQDGSIVIAAITSCTNTSNPNVLVAAGLLAKKALEKGLNIKKFVKTSFAPGSKVVSKYLDDSGLTISLDKMGFNVVGYGCTTCIGNSGPLKKEVSDKILEKNFTVCSVLSGNRNFEGRIHPEVKANYLGSPPIVIAYAIAGNINFNFKKDHLGYDKNNNKVYLKDIWPNSQEIQNVIKNNLNKKIFIDKYKDISQGDENWKKIKIIKKDLFDWSPSSTYVKRPPYFIEQSDLGDIVNARVLVMLDNSITTDHISPAGAIKKNSPAGKYLSERQIAFNEFNSYGSRRGNHEIMIRGTFANIRLQNELVPGDFGGLTKNFLNGNKSNIYDIAMEYKEQKIPLIIIAGKEYGTGSSRDWAAKGTNLLGIKAVIAESFERIHRSNLIGMGVLPLEFINNENRKKLKITGEEFFTINEINKIKPKKIINCNINKNRKIKLLCRIDTEKELEYYKSGGILKYLLNQIIDNNS